MVDTLVKLVEGTRWKIFPCELKKDGKRAVKKPCINLGKDFQNASNDPEQIKSWWNRFNATMYGILTGRVNNIVVLDVDRHSDEKNGFETIKNFEAQKMSIPDTLTVATPSGGLHYYFKYPEDCDIRNSAGVVGTGLDIRGNGGFIVGFMSSNEIGEYKLTNRKPLAQMPGWLIERCKTTERKFNENSSNTCFSSFGAIEREVVNPEQYAEKVFFNCCSNVQKAESGTRNNTLFKNAAILYSFSAGGYFSDEMIYDQLMNACLLNGLIEDKGKNSVIATLKSARNHGCQQPSMLKRRIENA